MSLFTYVDNLGTTLSANYTASSGVLALTSVANWPTGGGIITVITAASYQTSSEVLCQYTYSGVSGSTLTGVAAVSGFTDQNFSAAAIAEMRVPAKAINDLNTATTANTTALNSVPAGILKGVAGVIQAATAGTDYLTTNQTITLSGAVTGSGTTAITTTQTTVGAAHGGTGQTSLTTHAVLLGEGTSAVGFATVGTAGRLLIDQGAAADPAFEAMSGDATITSGGVITVASIGGDAVTLGGAFTTSGAFTTTLTVTANTNVTLPTSGTLVNTAVTTLSSLASIGTITTGTWQATPVTVPFGGSGVASHTAYAVLCGGTTSTGVVQSVASVGTSGQVLTSNGPGALPTFQASASAGLSPSSSATYTTPISPVTITTSSFGCPAMVSTTNLAVNADATSYVQAILNLVAPGGVYFGRPLEVIVDQQLMVGQLGIYSGTTIRGAVCGRHITSVLGFAFVGAPTCGLWSRPMTGNGDAGVLVNANPQSNYIGTAATIFTPTNIVDHDITIRDLFIDGCRRFAVANGSDARINASGNMVRPIIMMGVANLTIDNVFVYDPTTLGIHAGNIYHANFSSIRVVDPIQLATPTPGFGRNTAGIQLLGPWDLVSIRDIEGCVNDDVVALNSADGNLSTTITALSGPQIFSVPGKSGSVNAEFGVAYYGNGGSVSIRNLRLLNSTAGIRILAGSDPRLGTNPSVLTYVDIDGVSGNCGNGPLIANNGVSFGTGAAGTYIVNTLLMRNVSVLTTPSQGVSPGIQVPACFNATFKGLHFPNLGINGDGIHQIIVNGNCGTINVVDYVISEDANESTTPLPAVSMAGFTVGTLNINGMSWTRNATTATAMISVSSTASIGSLQMNDVSANNLNNILSTSGTATVTNVTTSNLVHLNANSNASLHLGSSTAVARLRSSGSNTVLLADGTAPISKKTDGTEDA